MPTIQAFISDLDDTLLGADHQLSARTEKTLRRILKAGVKVILASGRSTASMRPTVRKTGTPYPYIGFNGAQIADSQTGEILYAQEIPLALAREVLRWLEDRDIYAQYYDGDDWFYKARCDLSDAYAKSTGIEGIQAGTLSQHIKRDTPKLLAMAEPERVRELTAEGRLTFGNLLSITTSKPFFLEITSPKATKGNAVKVLADKIGLSPETTLCAGDSLNDMSMLTWSGLPVTVANGRDEIKEIAWRVAGPSHEDGIAILLDELIPEGMEG